VVAAGRMWELVGLDTHLAGMASVRVADHMERGYLGYSRVGHMKELEVERRGSFGKERRIGLAGYTDRRDRSLLW
jgi:hypothetical protein